MGAVEEGEGGEVGGYVFADCGVWASACFYGEDSGGGEGGVVR